MNPASLGPRRWLRIASPASCVHSCKIKYLGPCPRSAVQRFLPASRSPADASIQNNSDAASSSLPGDGAAAWPFAAQQPKMLRVGLVGMQRRETPHYTNFLKRMAELGYQKDRNFTFDDIQTPDIGGYEA